MRDVIDPRFGLAATEHSQRPVFADSYAVAGRFISVESSDEQLRNIVDSHFAAWHVEQLNECISKPGITISIQRGRAPSPPENIEPFQTAQGVCYTDANSYFYIN